MDKNYFRYTIKRGNGFTFCETFSIEEIAVKFQQWLDVNYIGSHQIKSIDQYTGETDVNNKPIFENDTVRQAGANNDLFCGTVEFLEGQFWVVTEHFKFPIFTESKQWEIVENVEH